MRILLAMGVAGLSLSCAPTPLPQPPDDRTASFDLFSMRSISAALVAIDGAPGAITPGDVTIRFTYEPPPNVVLMVPPVETTVVDDGSFAITTEGTVDGTYFVESLEADEDRFLGAFTGGPNDTVVAVDPGPDADGDGSPDEIDCAPDDATRTGQRCP